LSLDDNLSQEYSYQKLLKSDIPSSRYSRKCQGYFFWDTVYYTTTTTAPAITTRHSTVASSLNMSDNVQHQQWLKVKVKVSICIAHLVYNAS